MVLNNNNFNPYLVMIIYKNSYYISSYIYSNYNHVYLYTIVYYINY